MRRRGATMGPMHRSDQTGQGDDGRVLAETIPAAPELAGTVRVAAIVSRYHADITGAMLADARETLRERVGERGTLEVIPAAGSFEIPTLAAVAAGSGKFDAVVTLGCIIKGQTYHDEVIAHAIAAELARLSAASGVPIGFGVLTVLSVEQAWARAGGEHGRKGRETMAAALDTLASVRALGAGRALGEGRGS